VWEDMKVVLGLLAEWPVDLPRRGPRL